MVSIIIPVYGTEGYLPACIESVCAQTYPDLQIILVDDGSPDRCGAICDEYARRDPRITVIHQENRGVSAARNAGICRASGEYLMFVDSDDELEPNAVEVLLADIQRYGADMASASKRVIARDGSVQETINDGSVEVYEGEELLRRSLGYERFSRSLHGKLFTMAFAGDLRFDEGHDLNEDGYYIFQCALRRPKVVQHNVCLYRHFYRENSASNAAFSDKYLDMLYYCGRKMDHIREHLPQWEDEAKSMAVRTNLLFLEALCRTTDGKYRKIERECIRTVRELYAYHRPVSSHHRRLARIVRLGLYPLYKRLVRAKYYGKGNCG